MRLFLIRHGQTTANAAHQLDTVLPGAPLTELGRQQAAALPAELADEHFDGVWCSPAIRARDTAAPLASANGVVPQVRAGLQEIQAGELEMSDDRADWAVYLAQLEQWIRGDLSGSLPGGESGAQAVARFDTQVAAIQADRPRQAAIVAHGAMIRLWVATRAADADRDFVINHPLKNTGYVVLTGTQETGWSLTAWHADPAGL